MLAKYRALLLVILVCFVVYFSSAWLLFLYTPIIKDEQGFKYTVRQGASIKSVVDDLYLQNITQHPRLFILLARWKSRSHKLELKAGEYLFHKGATPSKLLEQMVTGSGMVYREFTIVEGWNFRQIRQAIMRQNDFHHVIQTMSDADIMRSMGYAEGTNPEGLFFPDTYYFVEGSSDLILLKRAFQTMQKKLNVAWQKRDLNTVFYQTPYQALIAASLVEKEAYFNRERPIIAGVLVNRLKRNMLLQIDPTVIYGMGTRYNGKIYRENLLAKNPYNTYVNKGLPPTPIAMPSLESIQAVMHPQVHNYFYFVAWGDGTHRFSFNLAQHYLAVSAVKKIPPPFFNSELVRYYIVKIFAKKRKNYVFYH